MLLYLLAEFGLFCQASCHCFLILMLYKWMCFRVRWPSCRRTLPSLRWIDEESNEDLEVNYSTHQDVYDDRSQRMVKVMDKCEKAITKVRKQFTKGYFLLKQVWNKDWKISELWIAGFDHAKDKDELPHVTNANVPIKTWTFIWLSRWSNKRKLWRTHFS